MVRFAVVIALALVGCTSTNTSTKPDEAGFISTVRAELSVSPSSLSDEDLLAKGEEACEAAAQDDRGIQAIKSSLLLNDDLSDLEIEIGIFLAETAGQNLCPDRIGSEEELKAFAALNSSPQVGEGDYLSTMRAQYPGSYFTDEQIVEEGYRICESVQAWGGIERSINAMPFALDEADIETLFFKAEAAVQMLCPEAVG